MLALDARAMNEQRATSHVLVVEDDEKLAGLLCRVLADLGLRLSVAFDGETALRAASQAPYDLVVLDVGLPGISGIEVCAQLRAGGQDVPVLMLSARDGVDDVLAGKRAGAADYLVKPFSIAELSARVHELINARAPHRTLIRDGESGIRRINQTTEGVAK